ncbi:MAG TPA: aspartate ammonia-lyase [Verrucomicrobia bacterium]|nr:MAG: aspartate ammonia-lyase [Lentisphaerae bacterium GWF2_57_35]HBA85963.1 aspartate ammonia-lyase [Verrucomicrobiota bacterium]
MDERTEKDLLGEKPIPASAYWGIHTLRAVENFPLSGRRVAMELVRAFALVKKACCQANRDLKHLSPEKAAAIEQACDEMVSGQWADQFPVDALQGGAGTSTNMNVNEVLANRALEILGQPKGAYEIVHPIEHVNLHQSTNDAYPTALKIAAILGLRNLSAEIALLQGAFQRKEKEFAEIVKIGRTEWQEAVPMTLGAEFSAFAEALARDRWRTFKCEERLRVINLGGTAIGTGLTAPRRFIFLANEKIREITRLGLTRAENMVDATANADCYVEVSGMLTACACNLLKISRDLRFLHALGEIHLPSMQAGSSIMPGKINPVILEAVMSAAIAVKSEGIAIADAASLGSLQINEFLPVIADALLDSLRLLRQAARILAPHIDGITANAEECLRRANESPMLITAFIPRIGYEKAQDLVREFQQNSSGSFRDFLVQRLGAQLVDEILSPLHLTRLGYPT